MCIVAPLFVRLLACRVQKAIDYFSESHYLGEGGHTVWECVLGAYEHEQIAVEIFGACKIT